MDNKISFSIIRHECPDEPHQAPPDPVKTTLTGTSGRDYSFFFLDFPETEGMNIRTFIETICTETKLKSVRHPSRRFDEPHRSWKNKT